MSMSQDIREAYRRLSGRNFWLSHAPDFSVMGNNGYGVLRIESIGIEHNLRGEPRTYLADVVTEVFTMRRNGFAKNDAIHSAIIDSITGKKIRVGGFTMTIYANIYTPPVLEDLGWMSSSMQQVFISR